VVPGSHDHKAIVAVFNALPKPELFASTPADLRGEIATILAGAETDDVVVTLGPRGDGQRLVVLVVMPRERFSGEVRDRIRDLLAVRLGGTLLDDQLVLLEGGRAVLHFAFAPGAAPPPAEDELRNEAETTTALRFYLAREPLVLSEFMPVLENLGLRVLAEDQEGVTPAGAPRQSVQTFFVQDRAARRLDPQAVGPRLTAALLALGAGRAESDGLGRLVIEAGLDWRAGACLRTYCGHATQVGLATRPAAID